MVRFFEMPFEFDNVPLASLQIISLPPTAIFLLQLFTITNTKDALSCIQATAPHSQRNCKRVSEHNNWQLYSSRMQGRDSFESKHHVYDTQASERVKALSSERRRSSLLALDRQVITLVKFSNSLTPA